MNKVVPILNMEDQQNFNDIAKYLPIPVEICHYISTCFFYDAMFYKIYPKDYLLYKKNLLESNESMINFANIHALYDYDFPHMKRIYDIKIEFISSYFLIRATLVLLQL